MKALLSFLLTMAFLVSSCNSPYEPSSDNTEADCIDCEDCSMYAVDSTTAAEFGDVFIDSATIKDGDKEVDRLTSSIIIWLNEEATNYGVSHYQPNDDFYCIIETDDSLKEVHATAIFLGGCGRELKIVLRSYVPTHMPMAPNTNYVLRLNGLETVSGRKMTKEYSLRFKTGPYIEPELKASFLFRWSDTISGKAGERVEEADSDLRIYALCSFICFGFQVDVSEVYKKLPLLLDSLEIVPTKTFTVENDSLITWTGGYDSLMQAKDFYAAGIDFEYRGLDILDITGVFKKGSLECGNIIPFNVRIRSMTEEGTSDWIEEKLYLHRE